MKTSAILIILILFNTTALIAEPLAQFVKEINTWLFIIIEVLLFIGYYINSIVKDVRKVAQIDFTNLKLFVIKSSKK